MSLRDFQCVIPMSHPVLGRNKNDCLLESKSQAEQWATSALNLIHFHYLDRSMQTLNRIEQNVLNTPQIMKSLYILSGQNNKSFKNCLT